MHARDDRFWALGDGQIHSSDRSRIGQIFLICVLNHPFHPVQIRACAKRFAVACEYDYTDVVAASDFSKSVGYSLNEFVVKRVVNFRTVEDNKSNVLMDLDLQHGSHIRNTPKRVSSCGAFIAAEIPRARTLRVSRGSMIPSSQRRAVL